MTFPGCDADSFVAKEQIADYFAAYAKTFNAPIKPALRSLAPNAFKRRPGFRVETSLGVIEAQRIVAATGPFQRPVIPAIAPQDSAVQQIHSALFQPAAASGRRRAGGWRRLVRRANRR
jgi:putative flavoprotein involved in K+ transport